MELPGGSVWACLRFSAAGQNLFDLLTDKLNLEQTILTPSEAPINVKRKSERTNRKPELAPMKLYAHPLSL